jgi:hypothetical protein
MKLLVYCDILPLTKERYLLVVQYNNVCLLWQWYEYNKILKMKETVTLITADVLSRMQKPMRTHTHMRRHAHTNTTDTQAHTKTNTLKHTPACVLLR